MEKPLELLQSQQCSLSAFKTHLEQIMSTFQEQRWQYEQEYATKTASLQKQIQQKNQIIRHLSKRLELKNQQLVKSMKDIVNYRKIVKELKEEFFKIGNVVNKIGTFSSYEVTLDSVFKDITTTSNPKQSQPIVQSSALTTSFSPRKSMKFDINGYFKHLRQTNQHKQSDLYLKEEKTAQTKTTEENSLKDIINQPTSCKGPYDGNGMYTMLKQVRSSQKSIKEEDKRMWRTGFSCFKQNNRRALH